MPMNAVWELSRSADLTQADLLIFIGPKKTDSGRGRFGSDGF